MKNHKWDFLKDICLVCGLKRRVKRANNGYDKMMGRYTEYLVNGKWTTKKPECVKQKNANNVY